MSAHQHSGKTCRQAHYRVAVTDDEAADGVGQAYIDERGDIWFRIVPETRTLPDGRSHVAAWATFNKYGDPSKAPLSAPRGLRRLVPEEPANGR